MGVLDEIRANIESARISLDEAGTAAERASAEADQLTDSAAAHGWVGVAEAMDGVHGALEAAASAIHAALRGTTAGIGKLPDVSEERSSDEVAAHLAAIAAELDTSRRDAALAIESLGDARTGAQDADAGSVMGLVDAVEEHVSEAQEKLHTALAATESGQAKALAWGAGEGHGASSGESTRPVRQSAGPTASATPAPGDSARLVMPHADEAHIDSRKLTDYALNPDHPVGRNKARVFESTTGFTRDNHDSLLEQLHAGVRTYPAELGKADQYGQRYTVDIPVQGPGGEATVRTGWLLEKGSNVPRLLTLFVK
jgi:hypothetical protein